MQNIVELPKGLQVLHDRLNFRIFDNHKVKYFETFLVDLSSWNLSLTAANPVIWVRENELLQFKPRDLVEQLRDVVWERQWMDSTILLFLDGSGERLKEHLSRFMPSWLIVDAIAQERVVMAEFPTPVYFDILLRQMERSRLSPYETHKPVMGSQFFGRQAEINRILTNSNKDFLLIGIRRIGKSSLLKQIMWKMDIDDPPKYGEKRRVYIDCSVFKSEVEFLQQVTSELVPSETKLLMRRAAEAKRWQHKMFERFHTAQHGKVTFLVDELDRLMEHIGANAALFDVLRAASNSGYARFIMAGFRSALKAYNLRDSPFFNFAEPVNLGAFKRAEVELMIWQPMDRLRINLRNKDAIISRIYRETAGLPNYVQYYCKALLQRLDEEQREEITEDDVDYVYNDWDFRDFVLDTFTSNTEVHERALVYALLSEAKKNKKRASFSQNAMDAALKKRNLNFQYERLNDICRNLEVAGVFNQMTGGEFVFAVPLLQQMLDENHDVDFLFRKAREQILEDQAAR